MQKILSTLGARWFQFVAMPLTVLVWFVVTDPSGGADTLLRVQLWGQAFLITGLAYLIAKAMLGKASSQTLYARALEGNVASGLAYLGMCLLRTGVLMALLLFFAQVQR